MQSCLFYSSFYAILNAMKRICCLLILFLCFVTLLSAQEHPDALSAYRTGRSLESSGKIDAAYDKFKEASDICLAELQENSRNMESYVVLCWSFFRMGKYHESLDYSKKALKINPNEYRIIENLGETYFYLKNYSESLKCFEEYVDNLPHGDRISSAYFFIGEIYRIIKKPNHADIAYSYAVREEPDIALWWYKQGLVREETANVAGAKAAYNRALALNPSYTEARNALNRLH